VQQLEEVVNPALATGKIVLTDRFNDSTVAYQGAARGLGTDAVQQLCDWVCGPTVPALTFLLDLPVEEGFKRQLDRMETETLEFHFRVREAFISLATSMLRQCFAIIAECYIPTNMGLMKPLPGEKPSLGPPAGHISAVNS
jgi:dTMP kinase